jgi:hypothetical protein
MTLSRSSSQRSRRHSCSAWKGASIPAKIPLSRDRTDRTTLQNSMERRARQAGTRNRCSGIGAMTRTLIPFAVTARRVDLRPSAIVSAAASFRNHCPSRQRATPSPPASWPVQVKRPMSAKYNGGQTVLLVQLNDFRQNFAVEPRTRFKRSPVFARHHAH